MTRHTSSYTSLRIARTMTLLPWRDLSTSETYDDFRKVRP